MSFSQSIASTRFSDISHSSSQLSGMLRQKTACTGMKSTAKITFSFGRRMTSELSE